MFTRRFCWDLVKHDSLIKIFETSKFYTVPSIPNFSKEANHLPISLRVILALSLTLISDHLFDTDRQYHSSSNMYVPIKPYKIKKNCLKLTIKLEASTIK